MMLRMGELILIRHGETEWSRDGLHTGRTDVPLTPAGRAADTARLAGFSAAATDPDLWEWDYGGYEGLTSAQITDERPGWYLWRDGVIPGDAAHPGETVDQVGDRADKVLARVRPLLPRGDVALVAHGHLLRILTARWLDLDADSGRLFRLDTGTVSTLGGEHDEPVISSWNVPPAAAALAS
jgi:probable phosphoglycerate mutase